MQFEQFQKVVQGMMFKPGWTFEAFRGANPNISTLYMTFPSHDSSKEWAAYGYRGKDMQIASYTSIDHNSLKSSLEVYKAVAKAVLETEEHECREFLRSKVTLEAPFHPHRREGEATWRSTKVPENAVMRL